ncbi:polysaccharide deacetylase family protein [Dokdonella immobilis]|uniref:Polysaccharide deacetylase n=1 Tax=Dokdonella immobilis TaxID=578942 RepID=A0A1I4VG76_9GAMM|nr:polysaccharide deacetylase family protein [Dokdonella immobilis]SFN00202.1 Polysaccharide deacetylase [Dokdonella immobilis]
MPALMDSNTDNVARTSRRQILASLLCRTGLIGAASWLRSTLIRDLRILAYHRVLAVDEERFDFDLELVSADPGQFREQMRLLKRRFNPVRFGDVVTAMETGKRLPPRPVVVSFDDGYDDNYRIAFPILRELGVPAMFFVSTGHIESGLPFSYDWFVYMLCCTPATHLRIVELEIDQDLPATRSQRRSLAVDLLDRMKGLDARTQDGIVTKLETEWSMPRAAGHADCRPMNWAQLREMHAAGMEIGSHGVWHNMLAKLPDGTMREEVEGSRRTLERELEAPVDVISYPVGGRDAFDDQVVTTAKAAGYKLGCSYVSGTSPVPRQPQFDLHRLPVERHMNIDWFASLIGLPEAFSYPSRHRLG